MIGLILARLLYTNLHFDIKWLTYNLRNKAQALTINVEVKNQVIVPIIELSPDF